MKKIMIVGCPGSGKSTFSKLLARKMDVPVLHLDYIYHIDNFKKISREELKDMIMIFEKNNDQFIIDGNYSSTLEWRMQFCDTVILMDIDTDICVKNVLSRMEEGLKEDMSPGFDGTILDEKFLSYVKGFKENNLPSIKQAINKSSLNQITIHNYEEMYQFLNNI